MMYDNTMGFWFTRVRFSSCTSTAGGNLPVIEFPVIEIAVIELPVMGIPVMEIPVIEIAVIEFRMMSRFMMTVATFLVMVIMFPSGKYFVTNNRCYY